MANVCRPLQNGLPALRFAVIRRALELCFWNWALNPHAWVSLVLSSRDSSLALRMPARGCLDFSYSSPCICPCASDRDADVQLGRSHALAPLRSIARLLDTGSAAGASCAA